MSFRETSAWITFVTVLLAAAIFFGTLVIGEVGGGSQLQLLAGCALALVVLQVALHAAAAMLSPADARGPRDERERSVQLRSHRVGYYVLVFGVLTMFHTGHATFSAHFLLYHALIALILSTLAISLTQIVLFRLGR